MQLILETSSCGVSSGTSSAEKGGRGTGFCRGIQGEECRETLDRRYQLKAGWLGFPLGQKAGSQWPGLGKNKAACYWSCRGKDITSLTAPFLSEEPVGIWHATGSQILVWSQFIKGWMKTWEIETETDGERETLSPTSDYQYMLTPLTFKSQV